MKIEQPFFIPCYSFFIIQEEILWKKWIYYRILQHDSTTLSQLSVPSVSEGLLYFQIVLTLFTEGDVKNKPISRLPETANIDDMMYELYVIDKVKKGREAVERGESISIEELKREMHSW